MAKGYVKWPEWDLEEVFALVARLDIVRLILALAAQHQWNVHHLDVKSTFLNDDLQEEVYVVHPKGFSSKLRSTKCKICQRPSIVYGKHLGCETYA